MLAVALTLAPALGGCGPSAPEGRPVARVAGLEVDARMVEQVAARDGLTEAEARAQLLDTMRLVAAARQQQRDRGEEPGLPRARAEQLRRAARARLWLHEVFEPAHGPEAIPADHPLLERARRNPLLVHPELYVVCQVLVEPPGVEALEDKAVITAEPAWREAAAAALAPVRERIERNVPPGDAEACTLAAVQVGRSTAPDDPRLTVTPPQLGGFHLDACDEQDAAGTCVRPRFDPTWTRAVRRLEPGTWSEPFFTRFGLHLVYLHEHLQPQPAGEPATERALRLAVLDAWRAEALDQRLQQLGQAAAVRMVRADEEAAP